jgi:hypothetical protein
VVNGAEGLFFHGFFSISDTVNFAVLHDCKNSSTSSDFLKSLSNVAGKDFFASQTNVHTVLNDELVLNFSISLSLSTIRRTATDCTLHAESHFATFLRSTGDSSNHTRRSNTLLACCASTKFISNVLGFCTACLIAFSVISWKTILAVLSIGNQS